MVDLTRPLPGTPCCVLDFESTGFPDTVDPVHGPSRITEVGAVHLNLGRAPALAMAQRVNPGIPIDPGASRVTGITDADVADCPRFEDIADQVEEVIAGRLLVSHNAPADHAWLSRAFARIGRPEACPPLDRWLCTLVLGKTVYKYVKGGASLGAIARRQGLRVAAHGAAGDALATAHLLLPLLRMLGRGPDAVKVHKFRGRASQHFRSVQHYLNWQMARALEHEADMVRYQQGQGAAERPDCPWHAWAGLEPPAWDAPPPTAFCWDCGAPIYLDIAQDGTATRTNPDETPHVCRSVA